MSSGGRRDSRHPSSVHRPVLRESTHRHNLLRLLVAPRPCGVLLLIEGDRCRFCGKSSATLGHPETMAMRPWLPVQVSSLIIDEGISIACGRVPARTRRRPCSKPLIVPGTWATTQLGIRLSVRSEHHGGVGGGPPA